MEFAALDVSMNLGNSELVVYDLLHLDSLLSSAVLIEATRGRGITDENKVYYIPLPVECLWTSDCGLPLWATSSFLPMGSEHRSTLIMHKRHKYPARSRTGRWMDTRIPKPTAITSSGWWRARCYGDCNEVARLLNRVHAVGKHRHDGCGRVKEWRVEFADFEPLDTIVHGGKLIRPVPELAIEHLSIEPGGNSALMGWTQPYWKPRNFNYAWAAGTMIA